MPPRHSGILRSSIPKPKHHRVKCETMFLIVTPRECRSLRKIIVLQESQIFHKMKSVTEGQMSLPRMQGAGVDVPNFVYGDQVQ